MDALFNAIVRNNPQKVEQLLRQGINPNHVLDQSGITALHLAAQNNALLVVMPLICAGANPHASTRDGYLPIDIAVIHQHHAMAKLLAAFMEKVSVSLH